MKKYGLVVAGILVLVMIFSFAPSLFGMSHEEKEAENIVIDPLCGMNIKPEDAAAKSEYKGKTYYFCMADEKVKFDKDPEAFIAKMEKAEPSHEVHEGHDHHEPEKAEKQEHEGHHEIKHEGQWMAPEEEAAKPNPVEATEESLAKAKEIFAAKSAICHGESGKSDGVLADSLTPRPSDLTGEITRSHSDGDLFWKISNGKGAMPAWDPSYSENERWGLVNYIRSLSKDE